MRRSVAANGPPADGGPAVVPSPSATFTRSRVSRPAAGARVAWHDAAMTPRVPLGWPLAVLTAFAALTALVLTRWRPVVAVDEVASATARAHGLANPGVVDLLRVGTTLGDTLLYLLVTVVATVVFAVRRQRAAAGFTAVVAALIPVLWAVPHALLHRPRPVDGFVTVTSNGFPSGHSANAAALAAAAVLLSWPHLNRRGRFCVVLCGVVFAAWVGLTRVLLLAHWPTDVLGGWLMSVGVVLMTARVMASRSAVARGVRA